jgi:PAS domain S-box-containing protein
MLDPHGRITYCNDYLLRLTGWGRHEITGGDWFALFLPGDHAPRRQQFSDLLQDLPSAWHYDNEIITRTGELRTVHWNNTVLRSVDGEVTGVASLGEDITESRESERKIKRLNRPASVANGWTDLERWRLCAGVVDLEELAGMPCWMALDLASTRDICALRLVWRVDGKWITWGRGYVPKASVDLRASRGTVSYVPWITSGHLIQTDGDVTDYAVIERDINELRERFDVRAIAFDPWNAQDLCNRLTEAQAPMIKFVQGAKSYHPAMQEVERAYVGKQLVHDGDPVLTWNAANLVARKDVNGNNAPDRQRSADKIDSMAALFMAVGVAMTDVEPGFDMDAISDPVAMRFG